MRARPAMKASMRKSPLWLARGALAALISGSTACGAGLGATSASDRSPDVATLVGNPAPDFSLNLLPRAKGAKGGNANGVRLSLEDLRGQVVVVDFWGTYCAPCKQEMPKLQALNAKYASAGLRIVGVSEDEPEDKDKIVGFAAAHGATFAIGWDEDRSVAHQYKPDTMPSSYTIDRRGVIRYVHVGYRDGDDVTMEREVKGLLTQ
jgi:peroxiredoxin